MLKPAPPSITSQPALLPMLNSHAPTKTRAAGPDFALKGFIFAHPLVTFSFTFTF